MNDEGQKRYPGVPVTHMSNGHVDYEAGYAFLTFKDAREGRPDPILAFPFTQLPNLISALLQMAQPLGTSPEGEMLQLGYGAKRAAANPTAEGLVLLTVELDNGCLLSFALPPDEAAGTARALTQSAEQSSALPPEGTAIQ